LRACRVLPDRGAVANYLQTVLAAERREQFRVLYLDKRLRLLRDAVLGEGTVDHVPVYVREVLRRALETGASGMVLVRNRPSGAVEPTPADIETTRQISNAARALRISVHDQLLVAGRAVVSFRGLGLL
jgi:DNA repair protein RadC